MNTLALLEKITHLLTELVYGIAYILYLAWLYRHLIGTMILLSTLFFLGVFGYAIRMEQIGAF